MGHLDVICQTIMNMPVQPSCYPEKHASPGLFINTIPYLPIWYLANLNILACYFSFSTHLFNSTLECARTTEPKLNHLFVMASIACECSKTPSKDKPNQNAVVHSIVNSRLPKVLSSWYIQVVPLPRRRSEQICDFRRMVYLQAAQKNG